MIAPYMAMVCMLAAERNAVPEPGPDPTIGKKLQAEAQAETLVIKNLKQWDGLAGKGPELSPGATPHGKSVVATGTERWYNAGCPGHFAQLEVETVPADREFMRTPNYIGDKARCLKNHECDLTAMTELPLVPPGRKMKWQARMLLSGQWQECNLKVCVCVGGFIYSRTKWKEFSPEAVSYVNPPVYVDTRATLRDLAVVAGLERSGSGTDLAADDGNTWTIRGRGSPKLVTVQFNADFETDDVSSVRLSISSHSDIECDQRIEALARDGTWISIDERPVDDSKSVLRDLAVPAELLHSSLLHRQPFVSFRVSCERNGVFTQVYEVDQLVIDYGRSLSF